MFIIFCIFFFVLVFVLFYYVYKVFLGKEEDMVFYIVIMFFILNLILGELMRGIEKL